MSYDKYKCSFKDGFYTYEEIYHILLEGNPSNTDPRLDYRFNILYGTTKYAFDLSDYETIKTATKDPLVAPLCDPETDEPMRGIYIKGPMFGDKTLRRINLYPNPTPQSNRLVVLIALKFPGVYKSYLDRKKQYNKP